ncbi:RNA dependent RNA polymerase-domain-containing protein [Xylariales sp. AK1849]|nr:RNA dependent RNA polymerase-domain-containing protein [Xylariales sp. AK1849]
MRVLLHCQVNPQDFALQFDQSWTDQNVLWLKLQKYPKLKGRALPEKSGALAWKAALADFRNREQAVVLTMSLESNSATNTPFFRVTLHPLKLDQTYRLSRRFGPDRFIEMLVPSIDPNNIPRLRNLSDDVITHIKKWVINLHPMFGRVWAPFFIRPFREKLQRKASKEDWFEPDLKPTMRDRMYLFAEDGNDFQVPIPRQLPPKNEAIDCHTKMSRDQLIRWLLQTDNNLGQPTPKLFSRIALGLSRTFPTVVLQNDQIRHIADDRRSPTGKIMNDGIGRMSPVLAQRIRIAMGLTATSAGFQGRIGCAKGFWICDGFDKSEEIWIETYPSQRKWTCDFVDEDHRVFEVCSGVRALESASLNTQFLPILEQRAPDQQAKEALRTYIGDLLIQTLDQEFEAQRTALDDPVQMRLWVDRQGSPYRRQERLRADQVSYMGGIPRSEEDQIAFLLDGGFDPKKQKFLWDRSWKLCKDQCEELRTRINIKVGRSTYAYMVADFWGILEEGEIHLGFSSAFKDEASDFSKTFIHGMDVLVARLPAHFVSDIQKVKAVFKPEFDFLTDVVVFSMAGNVPLADKLSGGDYDGDQAFVCWEPNIVNNFVSADVPLCPDLFQEGFLSKQTGTLRDLRAEYGDNAMSAFFEQSFTFNMQPNFLGRCTVFKEHLCYQRRSVSDFVAKRLSTLLSNLVDQAKQGIIFTTKDLSRFRKDILGTTPDPSKPLYKLNVWEGKGKPTHIIDYLKFSVVTPAIERELASLNNATNGVNPVYWDEELAKHFEYWNGLRTNHNRRAAHGVDMLINDLHQLHKQLDGPPWTDLPFEAKVRQLYEEYQNLRPRGFSGTVESILLRGGDGPSGYTEWDMLKASAYYRLNFQRQGSLVWWIVGSQLQEMKARATAKGPLTAVVPEIYAALRPDPKYIRARAARMEGLRDVFEEEEEPVRDGDD